MLTLRTDGLLLRILYPTRAGIPPLETPAADPEEIRRGTVFLVCVVRGCEVCMDVVVVGLDEREGFYRHG